MNKIKTLDFVGDQKKKYFQYILSCSRQNLIFLAVASLFTGGVDCFNLHGEKSVNLTSWRFTDKRFQFDVENLTLNIPNASVEAVNSYNEILTDVVILTIRSQMLFFVPLDLDKFFPNIQALQIFNSSLKVLEQGDIRSFGRLRELWVNQNHLESLSGNLFKFNTELQLIVFSNNRLKAIGKYILVPLANLMIANFNKNTCIDKYAGFPHQMLDLFVQIEQNCAPPENLLLARAETFKLTKKPEPIGLEQANSEIKELRAKLRMTEVKLNLSDGHLDAAMKSLFVATKALESRGNREEFMAAPTENQFIDLTCYTDAADQCGADELTIRFNNMKVREVLGSGVQTVSIEKIKKLSIVEQQTLFLPSNLAERFKELTELTVTLSGLFTIRWNVFKGLTKLTSLDLSHNKLHEVPDNSFEDLENLISLDLSFNYIESVEDDAFNGLHKLQQLKLNNNYLIELSGRPFDSLKKLKHLYLQRNDLQIIDGNLFNSLTKLITADLSNNRCIDMSLPRKTLSAIEKSIKEKCARRP